MSLSLSSSNNSLKLPAQQAVRSGAEGGGGGGQQSSAMALPQNNGVNITIINPITNVSGSTDNAKLTPNPTDSFTPSTAPAPPPVGDLGYQQPANS